METNGDNMQKKMQTYQNDKVFYATQKYLNWFIFFLPVGMFKLAGISITFYIFLMIVYIFLKNNKKIFRIQYITDYMMVLLFTLFLISMIFSEDAFIEMNSLIQIKLAVQYIYWFVLAMFIKTWIHKYDFYIISKYFFYGIILLLIYKYVINPIAIGHREYINYLARNTFTFFMIISTPISLYYIYKRYSFFTIMIISIILFYFIMISGSRAGTILIFVELVGLLMVAKPQIRKKIFLIVILLIPLFVLINNNLQELKNISADMIEEYNPRVALLLRDTDRLDTLDKSWLIRKLMIQKGLKIFDEHPFLGIGQGMFRYYWVNLDIENEQLYMGEYSYNTRSPHNSYIKTLAESGIFSLILLLMIQMVIIMKGFKILFEFKYDERVFIYTSFIGMSIYFYVISAITGALPWFTFGLALSTIRRKK
jgi:O-antigen ligase